MGTLNSHHEPSETLDINKKLQNRKLRLFKAGKPFFIEDSQHKYNFVPERDPDGYVGKVWLKGVYGHIVCKVISINSTVILCEMNCLGQKKHFAIKLETLIF